LIGYYFRINQNKFWFFLIVMIILFIAAQIRIFTIQEDNIYNTIIEKEMKNGNYKSAEDMVQHTVNKSYADDETYYLKGLINATTDSKSEGMATWERGLRNFPDSALLNYQLAVANRSIDNKDKARKYIKSALKLDPTNNDYINLNKELSDDSDS
ncbi:rhomboid family intramembrane serine protease, partial [Staphylococcus cohnii]